MYFFIKRVKKPCIFAILKPLGFIYSCYQPLHQIVFKITTLAALGIAAASFCAAKDIAESPAQKTVNLKANWYEIMYF